MSNIIKFLDFQEGIDPFDTTLSTPSSPVLSHINPTVATTPTRIKQFSWKGTKISLSLHQF